MRFFTHSKDVSNGGIRWAWTTNAVCREYDTPYTFDAHWRSTSGRIVRVFPPQSAQWRDKDDRPRPSWHVTVHETPESMPFIDYELSPLTTQGAAIDLAASLLEE